MISDEFVAQLRPVFQAQRHLLQRINGRLDVIEKDLAGVEEQGQQLAELERLVSEIEEDAGLLEEGDLERFSADAVLEVYHSRQLAAADELRVIGFDNWDSFVRQCVAYDVEHNLDPLLPYEALLTKADHNKLRSESYEALYRWDKWDYLFVGGAGVLAALTDFLLVRIPSSMQYGGEHQAGSPLTEWIKNYDIHTRDDFFANWVKGLEARCKVPYDAQAAFLDGQVQRIPGMYPGAHRFQALGHDPVLGFVFGIVDILRGTVTGFSYDHLARLHNPMVHQVSSNIRPIGLIEAFLTHLGHLISDAFTPQGLPGPFMPLLQALNVGNFGEKGRTVAEVARWMYEKGYDFRHFLVGGLTPGVIEIILRAYIMLRHYSEHGETRFVLGNNPKYRSMLLCSHSIAALANAGKVALYQGNPLAINLAEWMALLRYLVPSLKYWVFDRDRLKWEHLERINDEGWSEIEQNAERILTLLAPSDFATVSLGLNGARPSAPEG
jgi:hypothetical protein